MSETEHHKGKLIPTGKTLNEFMADKGEKPSYYDDIEAWSAKDTYVPHGSAPSKEQDHHIALQVEALSDAVGSVVTIEAHEEVVNVHFVETSVFTRVMADAGELAPIGSVVLFNVCNPQCVSVRACEHHLKEMEVVAIKGGLFILYCRDSAFTIACNDQWIKPIQTDWKEDLKKFFATPSECGDVFIEFSIENGTDGGELTEEEFIEMCQLVVNKSSE